jgi:hypothetical protein
MAENLRDRLRVVLIVDVPPGEQESLRKGNRNSICISYHLTVATVPDGARPVHTFGHSEDYQIIAKHRADLVLFGYDTSRLVMVSVIRDFLQDDGIIVIDGRSSSISRIELARELSSMDCGDYRLLTFRRLPGALVVGYELGADRVTRIYG